MDTSNDGVVVDALRYKAGAGYLVMDSYFAHLLVRPPNFILTDMANPISRISMPPLEKKKKMGKSNLESVKSQFEFAARQFLRQEASSMRVFQTSKYLPYSTDEEYVQGRYATYKTDYGVKYYRTVLLKQILSEGRCTEFQELSF